jgi:hypothetical protein
VGAVCSCVWFGTGTKLTSKDKVQCFVRCEYILHPNFTLSSKQGFEFNFLKEQGKKAKQDKKQR